MNTGGGSGGGGAAGRTILDCIMQKLPSSRKHHVRLIVPDNGIPFIDYRQVSNFVGTKKTTKAIQFVDLLFADKKHDANDNFAFSIYSIDKTVSFLPQDETIMNEWLSKIRELHSNLYPEFKRYDSIFEARLLNRGLASTMNIKGYYRVAVCKESLDLIPLLTPQDQQQQQATYKTSNSTTLASLTLSASNPSSNHHHHTSHHQNHHHVHHHMETNLPNNFNTSSYKAGDINQSQPHHLHHHHHFHPPQHLPSHQRFCRRHPQLASKTIELVLRSIRRCGHTHANFYIESGRHSQIGEGDLWMAMNTKSTARQLHELLLATMKPTSNTEDQFLFRAPRSRSGSSSDNAHRSQQSRSSSLVCLNADFSANNVPTSNPTTATIIASKCVTPNTNPGTTTPSNMLANNNSTNTNGTGNSLNGNLLNNLFGNRQFGLVSGATNSEKSNIADMGNATSINSGTALPIFSNHNNNNNNNNIEEDGYLPMA